MPFSTIRKEHGSFLPETKASSPVACFGMAMKRRAGLIKLIQWGMMLFYLFVLLMPLVFPERILFWHNLQALSVFVFWGCGWPLVMLSTMIFGRIWCGVFCPDGTLTETISHYGKKRSIPRWIRWRGWSCLTLILYTLALFLSGATQNHTSTTILLGSLTLASALTGFLYGSGRRIWCMYLCPSAGILAFLAKLSPFHFRIDAKKWDAYTGPTERIHCAPLINIRKMKSTSACHACGRCSGYRNAVELAIRTPDAEILSEESRQTDTMQTLTLFSGISGVCVAVVLAKGGVFSSFMSPIPSFLNVISVFTVKILFLVLGSGLLLGMFLGGLIWLSWKTASSPQLTWQHLALGTIPLAGTGLFLGFSTLTFSFLILPNWVRQTVFLLQLALFSMAFLLSLLLGWRLITREPGIRHVMARMIYVIALMALAGIWSAHLWMVKSSV